MNVKLIRPDNGQRSDFVAVARGHVCLRLADTVTPAVRWYPLVTVSPHLTDMLYTVEPDQRTLDNILALTEILNSRDADRQKSRDMYIYNLTCDIEEALAA